MGIRHPQEGVVVFAKLNPGTAQLLLDEMMTVEIVGDGKRQERGDAQRDRAQHRVADIEVVMSVTRALFGNDAEIWIGSGILRHRDPEVAADLHALEDEIDAEALLSLHLPQVRPYVIFLADPPFRPIR